MASLRRALTSTVRSAEYLKGTALLASRLLGELDNVRAEFGADDAELADLGVWVVCAWAARAIRQEPRHTLGTLAQRDRDRLARWTRAGVTHSSSRQTAAPWRRVRRRRDRRPWRRRGRCCTAVPPLQKRSFRTQSPDTRRRSGLREGEDTG